MQEFLHEKLFVCFDEFVASSSLPCFTTDYFKNAAERYPGRVFVPLTDPEADVTFYLVERKGTETRTSF